MFAQIRREVSKVGGFHPLPPYGGEMSPIVKSKVLMGFYFFPRGGSAQVARYLCRALTGGAWTPSLFAGSLGTLAAKSNAEGFFSGINCESLDYSPSQADWAHGDDPMESHVPMHASYETKSGSPTGASSISTTPPTTFRWPAGPDSSLATPPKLPLSSTCTTSPRFTRQYATCGRPSRSSPTSMEQNSRCSTASAQCSMLIVGRRSGSNGCGAGRAAPTGSSSSRSRMLGWPRRCFPSIRRGSSSSAVAPTPPYSARRQLPPNTVWPVGRGGSSPIRRAGSRSARRARFATPATTCGHSPTVTGSPCRSCCLPGGSCALNGSNC